MHLLCLSAKSNEAVRELAGQYRDYLGSGQPIQLADLSYTAHAGRDHFSSRLAVVGAERKELGHRLEAHVRGEQVPGLWAGPSARRAARLPFSSPDRALNTWAWDEGSTSTIPSSGKHWSAARLSFAPISIVL